VKSLRVHSNAHFETTKKNSPAEFDILDKEKIATVKSSDLGEDFSCGYKNTAWQIEGWFAGGLRRRHANMVDRPTAFSAVAPRHVESGPNDASAASEL
jgi:hypothetical protein